MGEVRRGRSQRSRRRLGVAAAVLLSTTLGSACATVPPAFDTVAIQSAEARNDDGELKGDMHADTRLKGALIGAGAGAAIGAVGGGGVGLLIGTGCGPLAIFCAPIAVGGGVIIGGVGGLVVGGVGGGLGGLSSDNADAVNAVLTRLQQQHYFEEGLRDGLVSAIAEERQAPPEQAQALVTAKLDEVDLRQHWGQQLSIRFWASMTQDWDRGTGDPKSYTCKYKYTTDEQNVEVWLADDGKAFGDAFQQAAATFARWMARDMEAFTTRTPQPKTDAAPKTCFQD